MSDFLRVRLPNGYEATLSEAYVAGLEAGSLEVLDAPATNSRGVPLPATRKGGRPVKRRTTVAESAAEKTARRSATPAPSDDAPTTTRRRAAVNKPEEAPQ